MGSPRAKNYLILILGPKFIPYKKLLKKIRSVMRKFRFCIQGGENPQKQQFHLKANYLNL